MAYYTIIVKTDLYQFTTQLCGLYKVFSKVIEFFGVMRLK